MSTTPPAPPPSYPAPGTVSGARMPIPGNAELAIFLLVWIVYPSRK